MIEALREKIILLVEPYCISCGFDLVGIDVRCTKNNNFIQVLADRPQGGITIDECVELSKGITGILENENIFGDNYDLEVSSPGIDRPLMSVKDFSRSRGKRIVFYLKEPVNGILEHQGVVQKVENENVYIKNNRGDVIIPISCIQIARQVI